MAVKRHISAFRRELVGLVEVSSSSKSPDVDASSPFVWELNLGEMPAWVSPAADDKGFSRDVAFFSPGGACSRP
jgi:hypothetical protein